MLTEFNPDDAVQVAERATQAGVVYHCTDGEGHVLNRVVAADEWTVTHQCEKCDTKVVTGR